MIIKNFIGFLIILITVNLFSQQLQWRILPNSPPEVSRYEDCYFLNANTGWVVHINGIIYKTTNAGNYWITQFYDNQYHIRSIGFFDSLNGLAGLYDIPNGATNPILRTTNGGTNWSLVTNVPAPIPAGICGISIVNNLVMYGVGKIDGPGSVIKTTNGGNTWQSFNMTGIASRLVDCYFFSPDSGFVVGGNGPTATSTEIILFTSNGGTNWITRHTSTLTGYNQACWKFSAIDRINFNVSLNQANDSLSFLKSTDGGVTWVRLPFSNGVTYFTQGIGFLNSMKGWLGGDFTNPITYETTNGGLTWSENSFLRTVNRFHFINDTLAYAVGRFVYKYSRDSIIGISPIGNTIPQHYILEQNFPNPFNPSTAFKFELPKESHVKIAVYDLLGNEVAILLNTYLSGGVYQEGWDGKDKNGNYSASGLYFCRIEANNWSATRKMILLK